MAISIQDAVLTAARSILLDPIVSPATDGVFWTDAELLSYYNIGITRIIAALQESLTKTVTLDLVLGVEQTLPADAVRILKVVSNVPYAGLKRAGITEVSAEALQDSGDWYGLPPTKYVRHAVMYDPDVEALRWRCFPPNDGTGQVIGTYAYAPPEATATTDDFGLTEAYRDAMLNYILGSAFMKNSSKQDLPRSQFLMTLFNASVGIKEQADQKSATRPGTAKTSE